MRTKAEIMEEIEQTKTARFMNDMVDHWSDSNYRRDAELFDKIKKLERELESQEG